MTIHEAKKKAKKDPGRYGNVPPLPPVSAPTEVGLDQLQHGQKQALEIKLGQTKVLASDVSKQIRELETAKSQAKNAQNIQMVEQITGLQDSLKKLEKKLTSRITALKKQLKQVPADVKIWLDKISQDCVQYLTEVKKAKRWLYRGTSGPDAFVAKSWHERAPKDSDREAQVLFDQLLAQLGAVALRGNSIFTTSDYWHTKEFGDHTYIIFPVDGKSHYTYTNQSDLVMDNISDVGISTHNIREIQAELKPYVNQIKAKLGKKAPPSWFTSLEYAVEDSWPSWNSLKYALNTAKKYAAAKVIPAKYFDPDYVRTLITLDSFVKRWEPKMTNLAEALKKEREVYVSGIYYALRADVYGHFVAATFGVKVTDESVSRW